MNRLTSELCYELLGETRAALLECRQRGLWAWAAAYGKRYDSLEGMLVRVKAREEKQEIVCHLNETEAWRFN